MTIAHTQQSFGSSKGILVFPDHYVAVPIKHAKATADSAGLATLIDGRYIVKAGAIYPADDATAQGIVLNDYDVTDGDVMMAVVIHGFIAKAKLPKVPSANALAVLKGLYFLPIAPYVTPTITCTKLAKSAGEAKDTEYVVPVTIHDATFRDAATTLANWTFANEATVKFAVTAITLSADKRTAYLTLTASASTVAGTVTALVEAAAVSLNVDTAAINLITVS